MVVLGLIGGGLCLAVALDHLPPDSGSQPAGELLLFFLREAALFAALPVALTAVVLVSRGRNRLGGWMLLAIPIAVTVVFLPTFFILRFVTVGLSFIFSAALLAGLRGATRSPTLVTCTMLIWGAAALGTFVPEHLRARMSRAVENGDVEAAKRLLDLGFDPDDVARGGIAPLRMAVERGDLEMVQLLLEHEASTYRRDEEGTSPLTRSLSLGHTNITVEMLKARGLVPQPRRRSPD